MGTSPAGSPARMSDDRGRRARRQVLVVPGLCVSSYLRPACDALAAEGHDVWLLDPPGWPHGARVRPEPRSLRDVAAPLVRLLTAHDLRDVVLVGQSVGAQLAAHVAVAAPARVAQLVLQGPSFDPRWRTVPQAFAQWARDLPGERPSLLAAETPEWLGVGPRRVRRVLQQALADRIEETLRCYRGEVAVVVGERDPLSTRDWTRSLASRADLHVELAGRPHSAMHADPVGFAAVLRELLDRWP